MKFAKKMMLVDVPAVSKYPSIVTYKSNDPEHYLRSNTIPNLDNELKTILYRKDLSDREKWIKYTQILQRYLFFLNQERSKNSFSWQLNKINPFDRAPKLPAKPNIRNIYEPFIQDHSKGRKNVQVLDIPENRFQIYEPNAQPVENEENVMLEEFVDDSFAANAGDGDVANFYDGSANTHNFGNTPGLPEHDSDLEDEIYDVEQNVPFKRATKRNFDEPTTSNSTKSRKFKEKDQYNWIPRPALNRWLLDQDEKTKIRRSNRIKEIYKQSQRPEQMEFEEQRNTRKRNRDLSFDHVVDDYFIPSHKKQPRISLNRNEVANILEQLGQSGKGVHTQNIGSIGRIFKWDALK